MSKITEIQIMPIKPKNGLVGFVSLVIEDNWYVGNIAIYTRVRGGYRLVYPTKKVGEQNLPIFHPINKNEGENLEKIINDKLEILWKSKNN